MKKLFSLMLLVSLFLISGCGKKTVIMDGTELHFDKNYQDMYISYNYPSEFVEKELEDVFDKTKTYEFYKDNKKSFVLNVEEHSLGLSFVDMEEDAKKIENDEKNKDIQYTTLKVNGKNIVRYTYKRDDDFGKDTLYYVYYGGYSYAGVREYIKVSLINIAGREEFENAFLSSFVINN